MRKRTATVLAQHGWSDCRDTWKATSFSCFTAWRKSEVSIVTSPFRQIYGKIFRCAGKFDRGNRTIKKLTLNEMVRLFPLMAQFRAVDNFPIHLSVLLGADGATLSQVYLKVLNRGHSPFSRAWAMFSVWLIAGACGDRVPPVWWYRGWMYWRALQDAGGPSSFFVYKARSNRHVANRWLAWGTCHCKMVWPDSFQDVSINPGEAGFGMNHGSAEGLCPGKISRHKLRPHEIEKHRGNERKKWNITDPSLFKYDKWYYWRPHHSTHPDRSG